MTTSRPWTAYALRILSCALLFASGYVLLSGSTFGVRMREDLPSGAIALALSAVLSLLPLLFGRRFLGAFLVSAFLMSGIGAYWWTTIPWDEFIKDSGFPSGTPPGFADFLLVASPTLIAGFYATTSRASTLMADLKNRGADADEARRAAGQSFLSGAALLVLCAGLAAALWGLMASRVIFDLAAPVPTGVPAIVIVAALVTVAYALIANRLPPLDPRAWRSPEKAAAAKAAKAARVKAKRASG